jgi:lysine 2,3-aminomutase
MGELFRKLESIMVRPYYLFHCEPVSGNLHFIPSLKKGLEIMECLRKSVGGLCLPFYVFDLPGGGGKALLEPSWIVSEENEEVVFRTIDGGHMTFRFPSLRSFQ